MKERLSDEAIERALHNPADVLTLLQTINALRRERDAAEAEGAQLRRTVARALASLPRHPSGNALVENARSILEGAPRSARHPPSNVARATCGVRGQHPKDGALCVLEPDHEGEHQSATGRRW